MKGILNSPGLIENNDNKSKDNSFLMLFCFACLKYPEYSILINSKNEVVLRHNCIGDKTVDNQLLENNIKNPFFNKKCEYCDMGCCNICLKCGLNICDNCLKDHESSYLLISKDIEEMKEKLVVPIIDRQFYCNKHLLKFSKFCPICKVDLCKQCLIEHIHINCYDLLNKELDPNKFAPKEYSGVNVSLYNLSKNSKYFYSCYIDGLSNKKITYNMILNLHLIQKINSYINLNSKATPKKKAKERIIKNDIPNIPKSCLMHESYGDLKFNEEYKQLIMDAQFGNIKYYHILLDIKNFYIKEKKYNNNSLFLVETLYLNSLSFHIKQTKQTIVNLVKSIESNDFKFYCTNYIEKIDKMKLKINMIELNIKSLNQSIIDINYKLEYELRRKTGNLIAEKIIKEYFDDLEPIIKTEYILSLSIENLQEKISTYSKIEDKIKKDKYMEILKKKLKKALAFLNQIASNKDQLISSENYDINELKNENILIQFKNKNNQEKEIHKAIILNLFFILRKKLNDKMNYSIHNETIKLKSFVAEEISKLENGNENGNGLIENKNSINTINNLNNVNIKNNNDFGLNNINKDNIINSEKLKINKLCKNTFKFINNIKEKFEIIPLFKENDKFFEKLELNSNEVMQDTNLIEFNNTLEKINKSYKIDSIISIYNAFNLFIDGKKSGILIDKNNFRNSANIEQCLNKLYDDNAKIDEDLDYLLNKILNSIDDNFESLYEMKSEFLNSIDNYGNYFDTEEILKLLKINLPLKPLEIVKKLKYDKSDITSIENCYYFTQICGYLIVEECIIHLNKIKDKINNLNIQELFRKNIINNSLINQMKTQLFIDTRKDLFSQVWTDIKNEEKYIKNNEELNTKIKKYVSENEKEKFQRDLIDLISSNIKQINIDENDPQNLFLKSFMLQNDLYLDNDFLC